MILDSLRSWAPFRIDALGIVTLLGAAEMDQNLGQLTYFRYLRFLPLLGAYIVAGNAIVTPIPGFKLYNIDDGIVASDIAGWFGRWVIGQNFTWNSSCLHISNMPQRRRRQDAIGNAISLFLGFVAVLATAGVPILMMDWWGLVNAVSMMFSVVSRNVIISQNRRGLDEAYSKVRDSPWASVYKKALLISPDGRAILIFAPLGVLLEVLLTTPKPSQPQLYRAARILGWFGFALHIVSLGMSALINQLITVFILIIPTILVASGAGCDYSHVTSQFRIDRYDESKGQDTRSRAYLRLDLTSSQEESMLTWALFPQRSNTAWWKKYRDREAESGRQQFDDWRAEFGQTKVSGMSEQVRGDCQA